MNIKEQLLVEISRVNTDYIANHIGNDPAQFKELITILFTEKSPLPLRASWVASVICDTHPELMEPYLEKIILNLASFNHSGMRRNLLRHLATIELPEELQGRIYDDCFKWLISAEEPPAVKVHSMQILFNIGIKEPYLLKELMLVLDELAIDESGAIRSRSRNLLKKIAGL